MNQRLEKNPQIRLPENYKRIKENVLCIEFKAFTGNKNKNLALEIIDDVIFNCLRFHFLLPIVTIESKYKAKEISFQEDGKLSSIFQFSKCGSKSVSKFLCSRPIPRTNKIISPLRSISA